MQAWASLSLVFFGVTVAQLNDDFSTTESLSVILVAMVICLNSAFASTLNEKVLKTLDMPFWDQQLRIYALGTLIGGFRVAWTRESSVQELLPPTNVFALVAAVGCILSGSVAGILTGFIMYRLNNVVKVVANSGITILLAVSAYGLFGIFPFNATHFLLGSGIVLLGSVLYVRSTKKAHDQTAYTSLESSYYSASPLTIKFGKRYNKLKLLILAGLGATGLLFLRPASKDLGDVNHILHVFNNRPLAVIVYASSVNEGFCRTARAALASRLTFYVTGMGQESSKRVKPRKYLNISRQAQVLNPEQVFLLMDGFDALAQQPEEYILWCWPFVESPDVRDELCPKFLSDAAAERMYAPGQAVRWLNSGIMLCKAKVCSSWFEKVLATEPKHFETSDQGKASVACLLHNKVCKLDFYSRIAQSMFDSVEDLKEIDGKWFNVKTNSTPAFIHFNGDKTIFPHMDLRNALSPSALDGRFIHFENGKQLTFQEVCSGHLTPDEGIRDKVGAYVRQ